MNRHWRQWIDDVATAGGVIGLILLAAAFWQCVQTLTPPVTMKAGDLRAEVLAALDKPKEPSP